MGLDSTHSSRLLDINHSHLDRRSRSQQLDRFFPKRNRNPKFQNAIFSRRILSNLPFNIPILCNHIYLMIGTFLVIYHDVDNDVESNDSQANLKDDDDIDDG